MADADRYEDILHMPHHVSEKHRPMDLKDRAAQFMPFAALTGYGAEIEETARVTDEERTLSEDRIALVNQQLLELRERLKHGPGSSGGPGGFGGSGGPGSPGAPGGAAEEPSSPAVRIMYFHPDDRKEGGVYEVMEGAVKKIDDAHGMIVMENGFRIPVARVFEITPV